jgi:dipeptidyl aminopeptidase/acylaminoacyl peptidase
MLRKPFLSCFILLTFCLADAAYSASMPSVESFFQNHAFGGAALSPDGRLLAVKVSDKNQRMRLAVINLGNMQPQVVASFEDSDINSFRWVNDQRLVFDLTDMQIEARDIGAAPGLFAVNADGSGFKQLVERVRHFINSGNDQKLLPWNTFLLSAIGLQESNDVLAVKPLTLSEKKVDHLTLQRLNTLNGRTEQIDAPVHAFGWLFDGKDELRMVVTKDEQRGTLLYREPASDKWTTLSEFDLLDGQEIRPLFLDSNGKLYVETRNGGDRSAVYTYDLTARKLANKPLLVTDQFDIDATPITRGNKLLGFRYSTSTEGTYWLDPDIRNLQAGIDKALPTTVNTLTVPPRGDGKFVLVHAHADTQPGMYLLYNTQEHKLLKVGSAIAGINPETMSNMNMVSYKARDGLEIPAYLTLPKGAEKKNLPLVVLVHGGPFMRGEYGDWNPEVQFLASRGYAVLQPEFRGGTGFGMHHFKAGWKQWGLSMQDDLADGVRWAVAQGIVDPKRVCIAGASYGGYATLMGLVKNPDLYRCGVEWVGVTDINLLYTVNWSDMSDAWKLYGMPRLVGDPVTDAAQLKATSPLENAAKVRAPLLMAYGGMDQRVPLIHGEKFLAAVKLTNPNVEWIVYDREGHGWHNPTNRIDFWKRVESFLEKQIGKP